MNSKYTIDMTSGPVLKKILRFSVPLMFTGLLQLAYNTADTAIVGRFVGKQALAAVGSTGSLVNLFVSLFTGMSIGAGIVAARHIGEKDARAQYECVHTAMLLSIVSGVGIGIIYAATKLIPRVKRAGMLSAVMMLPIWIQNLSLAIGAGLILFWSLLNIVQDIYTIATGKKLGLYDPLPKAKEDKA